MEQDSIQESLNRSLVEFDCLVLNFYNCLESDRLCVKADLVSIGYVKKLSNLCQYKILSQPRKMAVNSCLVMIQESTYILNRFLDRRQSQYILPAIKLNQHLTKISALMYKYQEEAGESQEVTDYLNYLEQLAKME